MIYAANLLRSEWGFVLLCLWCYISVVRITSYVPSMVYICGIINHNFVCDVISQWSDYHIIVPSMVYYLYGMIMIVSVMSYLSGIIISLLYWMLHISGYKIIVFVNCHASLWSLAIIIFEAVMWLHTLWHITLVRLTYCLVPIIFMGCNFRNFRYIRDFLVEREFKTPQNNANLHFV